MEGKGDEGVKGFDDSEDERTTAPIDAFQVNPPLNGPIIVTPIELICSSQEKIEDDEYVRDELGSSDLDEPGDGNDKGPKFKMFRK